MQRHRVPGCASRAGRPTHLCSCQSRLNRLPLGSPSLSSAPPPPPPRPSLSSGNKARGSLPSQGFGVPEAGEAQLPCATERPLPAALQGGGRGKDREGTCPQQRKGRSRIPEGRPLGPGMPPVALSMADPKPWTSWAGRKLIGTPLQSPSNA